jgi:PAS domain S-box-containing protein
MDKNQESFWKKRLESITAENQSQRKRISSLKAELKEIRMRLKAREMLFNETPLGILILQDEKIIDINQGALDRLGFTAEEVMGRSFLDLIDPKARTWTKEALKETDRVKMSSDRYETKLITREGDSRTFEVFTKRIRFNRRKAFVLNLVEIDERKREEEERIQIKKREATVTIASGLNHAIDPILQDLSQSLEALEKPRPLKEDDTKKSLEKIASSISKLLHTTACLNGLTVVDGVHGQVTLLDPREMIENALMRTQDLLVKREEQGKGIHVKKYLRKVSPVEGNQEELQQLMVNMISNALEAMAEGGSLYLTIEESLGFAHIYIQDSGSGIPQKYMDRIFDPFFTTKGDGSPGMGLTLCEAVVKRHRGEIAVTSEENEGTTFTVKLPLAKAAKEERAQALKKGIKGSSILIVDTENLLRELLAQVLESKGCEVTTAANGPEGLNRLKRKRFDMVIAEADTANRGGDTFWDVIKDRYRHIPVVLLIGQGSEVQPRSRQKNKVDLIIPIPIDMTRVVSDLSALLTQFSES